MGSYGAVGGGQGNTARNYATVVSGGYGNYANADFATVAGGLMNYAGGEYSFAAGMLSSSTANGAFTWADSQGVHVENAVQDRTVFKNRGGFLVTGSTSPTLMGVVDRGFMVTGGGLVGISNDDPDAALDVVSTGTTVNTYAQIWRNSSGVEVASMTATGKLYGDGSGLSNVSATDSSKVAKGGDTMTGQLTISGSSLTVSGNVVFPNNEITIMPGGGTLAVNRAFIRLEGNGGPVNLYPAEPLGSGTAGQLVILAGTSDTNTVTILSGGNVKLSGGVSFTLAMNDTITLIYDGAKWIELSRSENQ